MTASAIARRLVAKHGAPAARRKVAARLERAAAAPSPLRANWLPWAAVAAALILRGER